MIKKIELKNTPSSPLALIILDGWGYREDATANAIAQANKPFWNNLWTNYPHTTISGSGRCVGLPDGQMGNSEVGHMNMGAGRVVHQDLTRIDVAIADGSFNENSILINGIKTAVGSGNSIHIIGLVSPGGVHSHERHFYPLLELAKQHHARNVYVHAFLDGRDTPPKSAMDSLLTLEHYLKIHQCGQLATLVGRYYAMDRDQRWDRVKQAYDLLTSEKAEFKAKDCLQALEQAYQRGETDEFVKPTQLISTRIKDGDVVIFMNFRADRARELTQAFVDPAFQGFTRATFPKLAEFICLTEYDEKFSTKVAFSPKNLNNILGEYLSQLGLKQLRIAETEKYAHVTFFFNGGKEEAYPLEDRILIPSPKVATYDLYPQMSAMELTERLISTLHEKKYDVIICNFANPDMVGHTGNLAATVQAIETIDQCLAKLIPEILNAGGEALITADHGNAEMMYNSQTRQPHTAHTCERVPFIYVGRNATFVENNGVLSDVAPTMLYLMGLPQPQEMTGRILLELE